jgi:hypothetical protein
MSVTITAVAGPGSPVSDVAAQLAQQEFVVTLQNSAATGMLQLANPAALTGELLNFLRGYAEKSQNIQRATKVTASSSEGEGASLVQTAALEQSRPDLHGGPAREQLEPAGTDSSVLSAADRHSLAETQRAMALEEAFMESLIEGTMLGNGASAVIQSFQTLLRGQ